LESWFQVDRRDRRARTPSASNDLSLNRRTPEVRLFGI
jgi:hypothetical protein